MLLFGICICRMNLTRSAGRLAAVQFPLPPLNSTRSLNSGRACAELKSQGQLRVECQAYRRLNTSEGRCDGRRDAHMSNGIHPALTRKVFGIT